MRLDGCMRPVFAQGKKRAVAKLLELRRQPQRDGEPRMVLRIQGILMSLDGHMAGLTPPRQAAIAAQHGLFFIRRLQTSEDERYNAMLSLHYS
jgi:hypothetical protein